MSVPRIDASGCGFWPTATAQVRECDPEQWGKRREQQGGTLRSTYLQDAVKYQVEARGTSTPQTWATPTQRDHKDTGDLSNVPENALLPRQVQNRDVESVPGSLNPDWVSWLMDWPVGWEDASLELQWECPSASTDCEHLATVRCLSLWLRRGRSWLTRLGY